MKNTIIGCLADFLAPNRCVSCGACGELLCGCCKKYYKDERFEGCLFCGRRLVSRHCDRCGYIDKQYVVALRRGAIKELINSYKYESVRSAGRVLAEMLAWRIGEEYAIVPLPTIGKHVRERGFDHVCLLAKNLERLGCGKVVNLLARVTNTVQVGSDEETRRKQAEVAYGILREPRPNERYLLLDDVCTTGSSLLAAEKILRRAGARLISVAVIAKSN